MAKYGWRKGWGPWHDYGNRYAVRLGDVEWMSEYRGRVPVMIADRNTGGIIVRVGDARMMGNFAPIWVNIGGKSIQVEKLLDLK